MPRTTTVTNNTRNNGGNNMNNGAFSFNELAEAIAQNIVSIQNRQNGVETVEIIPDGYVFAKNSQFYGRVMADGQIYNPYLVRRWLPAQFLSLMKRYDLNVDKGIRKTRDYRYMIKWVISEVDKLAYLEKVDKVAFEERKCFLSQTEVKWIMSDYCSQLKKALEFSKEGKGSSQLGREFYGSLRGGFYFKKGKYEEQIVNHRVVRVLVKSNEYKKLLNKIKYFEEDLATIGSYTSYQKISDMFKGFKFIYFKGGKLSWTLVDRYKAAGAYYTLKNLVLFEGVNVSTNARTCTSPVESAEVLKNIIKSDGYVIYAILKRSIEMSNYEI